MVYFVDMSENALWVCLKKNCNGTNHGVFHPCILQVDILESVLGLSLALKWGTVRLWRALWRAKRQLILIYPKKSCQGLHHDKVNFYSVFLKLLSFPYLRFSFLSSNCQLAKKTTSAVKRSIYHPIQSCVTLSLSFCSFYFTCNVAVLANGKCFTMGEGGGVGQ